MSTSEVDQYEQHSQTSTARDHSPPSMGQPRRLRRAESMSKDNESLHIEDAIKNVLMQRDGKGLAAFITIALQDGGDIALLSSEHIKGWTSGIPTSVACDELRRAHETALMSSASGKGDHDLLFPDQFLPGLRLVDGVNSAKAPIDSVVPSHLRSRDDHGRDVLHRKRKRFLETPEATQHVPESASRLALDQDSDDEPVEPVVRSLRTESLMIEDTEKVGDFLYTKLKNMQQLAVKRIAKAWIKGICPKKQAKFPYHNKRNEERGVRPEEAVPEWWPKEGCRFKEPDHIKRSERLVLCVHLLRLRPTAEQLEAWNNNTIKAHQTHVTQGWTAFLEELAPPSLLCEMREPEEKTKKRQTMVRDMYRLARMEEEFTRDEIDGTDRFEWVQEDDKPVIIKRPKPAIDASDSESGSESSVEYTSRRSKRPKTAPRASSTAAPLTSASIPDAKIEPRPTHVPSTIGMNDARDITMTDSFGSTGFQSLPNPGWRPLHAADQYLGEAPYGTQAPDMFGTQQNYFHDQSHWSQGNFFNDQWAYHQSPATSFSSVPNGNMVYDSSLPNPPHQEIVPSQREYHAFPPGYGQPVSDAKQFETGTHDRRCGDTVPNTPVIAPTQLSAPHGRYTAPAPDAFRPSAYQYHGMPVPAPARHMPLQPTAGPSAERAVEQTMDQDSQPHEFQYMQAHSAQHLPTSAFRQPGAAQMTLGYYPCDPESQPLHAIDRRFSDYV